MPIAPPFMDAFFIGESEGGTLIDVMSQFHEKKKAGAKRKELLEFLNSFSFVYVPSVDPEKNSNTFYTC